MLFLATLIHDTKAIKLATGTTNLAQMHPVLVAVNAAMFDHLAQGRFIMGISPGALAKAMTGDCGRILLVDDHPRSASRILDTLAKTHDAFVERDVQAGERIGDRELDALLEAGAQELAVPLALDLRPDPGQELVAVDRAHQIVVDAHIEAPQQTRFVAWFDQHDDRQVPCSLKGADLRTKPQPVGALQRQTDDKQIEAVVGKLQKGGLGVALCERVVCLRKNFQQSSGRAGMVVDEQNAA
jgi:hypothetical protein